MRVVVVPPRLDPADVYLLLRSRACDDASTTSGARARRNSEMFVESALSFA